MIRSEFVSADLEVLGDQDVDFASFGEESVDASVSFLDRFPLRKAAVSALAATALFGAAKASAAIEGYSNTPKGVAVEFVHLLANNKAIEACRLDVNNCIGLKKTDNPSANVRKLNKLLYGGPVSAFISPKNVLDTPNAPQELHGSTMVEVHTGAYEKYKQPFCEAVKKIDSEWKIVWFGWSTRKNSTCAKPL